MSPTPPRVVIIGAGFSGIGLGIRLRQANVPFLILEKGHRPGGTWRDNTYPGAACDIPAMAYCYSFEQKTDWSAKWSPQSEILGYIDHCIEKYDLKEHIRLKAEVIRAHWQEDRCLWKIETTQDIVFSQILVSAVGQLDQPKIPNIPGQEDFRGPAFHSARWDHSVNIDDKTVAVIGSAASAVQIVPAIAPRVKALRVFQRSPNWMVDMHNRAFTKIEHELFTHVPAIARLYRWGLWFRHEARFPVFAGHRFAEMWARWLGRAYLKKHVRAPELRARLMPDYPPGARRVLTSDHYLSTLEAPNVDLVTERIEHILKDGIRTRDGEQHPADILVWATGFDAGAFGAPMAIEGPKSRLRDVWKDGAYAYLGLSVTGFPNLFFMYGPNTNLGHNSIIFMIECQIRYILSALRQMNRRRLAAIDVKPDVMQAYQDRLQKRLGRTVWNRTDHSWYMNDAGRIVNNWAGTTTEYWWRTRKINLSRYTVVPE